MNNFFGTIASRLKRPINTQSIISRANTVISGQSQLARERVSNALQKFNSLTGYEEIDRLKHKVIQAERQYSEHRKLLWDSRQQYEKALQQRSQCQRDINNLLQRKHTWSSSDVNKFTELYSQEHALERSELELRRLFEQAEKQLEESHSKMLDSIRLRYQEEQVWSDNIRSLSSYGTVALMLLNLGMFIGVHTYMEPRRRQSLVENIDNRLGGHIQRFESKLAQDFSSLNDKMLMHEALLNANVQLELASTKHQTTSSTSAVEPTSAVHQIPYATFLKPSLYFIGGSVVGIISVLVAKSG